MYEEKDPEAVETMTQLLDIFIEEKINKNLSLIDNRLKYNSKVIYNGKSYTIKGVLKKIFITNKQYRDWETDRKSTRLNSSHSAKSRMPSSA